MNVGQTAGPGSEKEAEGAHLQDQRWKFLALGAPVLEFCLGFISTEIWKKKLLRVPSQSLGLHTDLSISHADKSLIHQLVGLGVPWLPLHDVTFSCFIGQGDGRDLYA